MRADERVSRALEADPQAGAPSGVGLETRVEQDERLVDVAKLDVVVGGEIPGGGRDWVSRASLARASITRNSPNLGEESQTSDGALVGKSDARLQHWRLFDVERVRLLVGEVLAPLLQDLAVSSGPVRSLRESGLG